MFSLAALIGWNDNSGLLQTLAGLRQCETVKTIAAAVPAGAVAPEAHCDAFPVSSLWSKQAVLDCLKWFGECGAEDLLLISGPRALMVHPDGLRRMVTSLHDTKASMVYGDYYDIREGGSASLHPLIDYQPGSLRDNFDFGAMVLINGSLIRDVQKAIEETTPDLVYGGLYDLRLRLSERAPVFHLPEPLYYCNGHSDDCSVKNHFAYVDPANRDYQIEMEKIATAHLQRIGACITAPDTEPLVDGGTFPVRASIVIPVKNRARTIGDAVQSALSQKTSFAYNVIVVDNHSGDGTTDVLAAIAGRDERLVHFVPQRTDLLIGGCWNEAVYSTVCGRYAVQLDSDDLYDGTDVLERIIAEFDKKPYALVIGSYTTVTFDLKPLPPGLVDHREWTEPNGPNNALRVAGLGAPRAYHVPTLRQFGFPNVSYGEDYAAVLRLCRSYPVGRIYDSLYWCRRWEENSDSGLALETANRYDFYKDRLRTIELAARTRREQCT